MYHDMFFPSRAGDFLGSVLSPQAGMEHSEAAAPSAPAVAPAPPGTPALTDHIWSLHDALQLQVPADILDHPDFNRFWLGSHHFC